MIAPLLILGGLFAGAYALNSTKNFLEDVPIIPLAITGSGVYLLTQKGTTSQVAGVALTGLGIYEFLSLKKDSTVSYGINADDKGTSTPEKPETVTGSIIEATISGVGAILEDVAETITGVPMGTFATREDSMRIQFAGSNIANPNLFYFDVTNTSTHAIKGLWVGFSVMYPDGSISDFAPKLIDNIQSGATVSETFVNLSASYRRSYEIISKVWNSYPSEAGTQAGTCFSLASTGWIQVSY